MIVRPTFGFPDCHVYTSSTIFQEMLFFSLNVHLIQMTFQQTKIGIFRRAVAMYYHLDQPGYCVKTFCAGHQVF